MPWRSKMRERGRFDRPPQSKESQNAQDEDQVGRKEALQIHRDRQAQARTGLQAPPAHQQVQADTQGAERKSLRIRNPARRALDALRLRGGSEMSRAPRAVASHRRRK